MCTYTKGLHTRRVYIHGGFTYTKRLHTRRVYIHGRTQRDYIHEEITWASYTKGLGVSPTIPLLAFSFALVSVLLRHVCNKMMKHAWVACHFRRMLHRYLQHIYKLQN